MNKRFILLPVFAIILFVKGYTQSSTSAYDANVVNTFDLFNNKQFESLQLEDTAGRTFNTSSLTGKTIYVDFWFTSCPPCLKEIPYSNALQQFFELDTNIVFLNICIDNLQSKQAWKRMVHDKKMRGMHLFYVRNRPQKINLLREYDITFPAYLLLNANMKVTGYNAPRPSETGWVHWAIAQAEKNVLLSESYKQLISHSNAYNNFIRSSWSTIMSLKP